MLDSFFGRESEIGSYFKLEILCVVQVMYLVAIMQPQVALAASESIFPQLIFIPIEQHSILFCWCANYLQEFVFTLHHIEQIVFVQKRATIISVQKKVLDRPRPNILYFKLFSDDVTILFFQTDNQVLQVVDSTCTWCILLKYMSRSKSTISFEK